MTNKTGAKRCETSYRSFQCITRKPSHLLPQYIRVPIKSRSARQTFRPYLLSVISDTRPQNEPKVQYNRNVHSVFRPENSFRDRVMIGGPQTPHLPRVKTSSRADLATSRSCHSDSGTNIQTTSFLPSLHDLSNCFPGKKPWYVSYSITPKMKDIAIHFDL